MIAQTSGRVVESVVVAIGIDGSLSSKKLTARIVSWRRKYLLWYRSQRRRRAKQSRSYCWMKPKRIYLIHILYESVNWKRKCLGRGWESLWVQVVSPMCVAVKVREVGLVVSKEREIGLVISSCLVNQTQESENATSKDRACRYST